MNLRDDSHAIYPSWFDLLASRSTPPPAPKHYQNPAHIPSLKRPGCPALTGSSEPNRPPCHNRSHGYAHFSTKSLRGRE